MKYFLLFVPFSLWAIENYYYEYGKKVYLSPVTSNTRELSKTSNDIHKYKTANGTIVKFKNEILVKLKKNVDIINFFTKYNLNYKMLNKRLFLIKVSKNQNIFQLLQDLYQDSDTEFVVPNKIHKTQLR